MTTDRTDKLICSRPFDWFEIHADGSVFCCCPAWIRHPIGTLLTDSVESIWNSPRAVEIRKTMLGGSLHFCSEKRCPFLKQKTQPVCTVNSEPGKAILDEARQHPLDHWPLPKKLNLCFDHSCNLACPSCRNSVLVSQDVERRQAERIAQTVFEQLVPAAHEITLSGYGDPFASPVYWWFLHQLNERPAPPFLRLHSNGQLFDAEHWGQLPRLQQQVRSVEISVDAASAATYSLNRPGGSFARLLANLAYISSCRYPLTLSMVVQKNNYREIPSFFTLAERFSARVYFSKLVNWGTFSREDYLTRAVHLPTHPQYSEFLCLLGGLDTDQRRSLGNLAPFLKNPAEK